MNEDFYTWSNDEILSAATALGGVNLEARIVGVYIEVGMDFAGSIISAGGEYVAFIGVDRVTNERIVAHYVGATISAGVSLIPNTNYGGGAFSFTGDADGMGGFSVGRQLSAGTTSGVSYSIVEYKITDILITQGANISVGANVSAGYTYKVVEGNNIIFNWGSIEPIETFERLFTGAQYDSAMYSLLRSDSGVVEIQYELEDGYTFVQTLQRVDAGNGSYRINVFEKVVDGDGRRAPQAIADQYLVASNKVWQFTIDRGNIKNIISQNHCFAAATPITMSDGTSKPIEDILPDDLIMSYDADGNLVPDRVVRIFQNDAKHILDFFGLMVTPGHNMLCGAGRFAGRHVTLLDILRSDGAVVATNGRLIRAATGAELGGDLDAEIRVVIAKPTPEGYKITQSGWLRMGTRVLLENGADISVADLIQANGGQRTEDGLIASAQGVAPLIWPFSDRLPAPEDYILARSAVTLREIYAANEWESAPSMHPPILNALGPMMPASNRIRDDMPANIPLSMRQGIRKTLQ